jgi:hexulose-6-phosphate isomerase
MANAVCFSMVLRDDPSAEPWLARIRTAGFQGIEPTFGLEATLPVATDPRRTAERLRTLADRAGLKIPSLRGGPGFWPTFASPDSALRARAAELADHALQAVKILGGDTLLIVPGQWDPTQTYTQAWQAALDTAKRIADVADRVGGVRVGLENVENRLLLSPREWAQFLDEINHPLVRMYFDVGNVVYLGLGPPEQWIRELGLRYITRIHFKDADQRGALRYMLEGQVNWPAVSQSLRDINYTDWVGVELVLPQHHPAAMLAGAYAATAEILKR